MDYYEVESKPKDLAGLLLGEVKCHCKIEHDDEDLTVMRKIKAAVADAEKITNRVLMERTIKGYFFELQVSKYEAYPFVTIRRAPIIALTSVQTSIDGVLTDVDSSTYYLKKTSGFSRLFFTDTPTCDSDVAYPLEIVFTAGYEKESDIPENIILGISQQVAFSYENRGDVIAEGKVTMSPEARANFRRSRIVNTFG